MQITFCLIAIVSKLTHVPFFPDPVGVDDIMETNFAVDLIFQICPVV
jgi:hypothetical protein